MGWGDDADRKGNTKGNNSNKTLSSGGDDNCLEISMSRDKVTTFHPVCLCTSLVGCVSEQCTDCHINGKIPTHTDISSTNIDGDSINPFIAGSKRHVF
jgi:hypothetical protein